jgi:acetylornithine deacetylase/succinyl-diaminopimelate desuccinylase-like protein
MAYATVDELNVALGKRLAESGYSRTYQSESAFETDVWNRLFKFMSEFVQDTSTCCLTSHTKEHEGRSDAAWKAFCREDCGPDVTVLGSNNRLDIVVKHPIKGSIGIEVKCLGKGGHASKLTQGIGQAMLALAHRDRTVLLIHCGSMEAEDRKHLRTIGEKISRGSKTSIIVVP